MGRNLTDLVCTRCALCCNGSLFADVELASPMEIVRLESMVLDVDEDGGDGAVLPQPCAALQGRRCSIYRHRPKSCRAFECQLLLDVRRGELSVTDAQTRIAETLGHIGRVERLLGPPGPGKKSLPLGERVAEAIALALTSSGGRRRRYDELGAAMADLERSIQETFLHGTREARRGSLRKPGRTRAQHHASTLHGRNRPQG